MANDRLWLGCPKCGEKILLWKHYPGRTGLSGYTPTSTNTDVLDAFFDEHLECVDKRFSMSFDDDCGLRLWTEATIPELGWQMHIGKMMANGLPPR